MMKWWRCETGGQHVAKQTRTVSHTTVLGRRISIHTIDQHILPFIVSTSGERKFLLCAGLVFEAKYWLVTIINVFLVLFLKETYYGVFPTSKHSMSSRKHVFEAGSWKKILPTILPLFPSVQSLQNVPFLVSVALMQMSCQSEPQHGGEVIAAVWRLQELYIYITLYYYIIIILLYNI